MNRGFGLILAVPIMFLCFAIMTLVGHVLQEAEDIEEYVLALAVDYATDAAAIEMLSTATLDKDYVTSLDSEIGYFAVDPEIALATFTDIMCLNYDMPMSETAKREIQSAYIPIFCVAAYDGYYLFQPQNDASGDYYLQGSPKFPYAYEQEDTYYALNLGLTSAYRLKDGNLLKVKLEDQGITKDKVKTEINSQISDQLMYLFQQHTGRGHEFVYIPQDLGTIKQVNPIEGPTVMAFIDNWDVTTSKSLSAFSIGGARIEETRMVAGYTAIVDGVPRKLYAYADLLPQTDEVRNAIEELFTSVDAAALAGYHYDYVYMD